MHSFVCRSAVLLLVALLVAPAAVAGPDQTPGEAALPDNLLVDTLPNGLEIVIEERRATPIVHVEAYMRIGGLYEGEYLGSGLSHYMEHIVSGGSTRRQVKNADGTVTWAGRTEEENKALVKSIGGNTNAATFYNYTKYYITTKSEMVDTAVDLISGYLQHCQFDPKEVEREQRVIQQELLRNQDNAGRERSLLFNQTMFKVHPIRVPVIGYIDSIDRITRDDMMRFYDKHYTPQNCVVSIVGDVDKEETLALVKEYFGGWKRKALAPYQIPEEPEQTSMRWVEKEHGSTKTCLVAMGVPTIPLMHPDLYKLDMLSNVLGMGGSARLPRKFEHDPTRAVHATGIGAGNWTPVFGGGRLVVNFSADTPEHARELVHEIWAEMKKLKSELVSPEEISRALKSLEKYHWMGRAKVDDRAASLASSLAWIHDPLYQDRYLEEMQKVTPEQVREAARTWLQDHKLNVVIVMPPQAPKTEAEDAEREAAGAVRKVVLDNGLTLLLKRVPDYGMVDIAAALNGGVIYEDEQTNGLFFLMAATFWRGSKNRPFPMLMGEMARLGMEMGAESHNNLWYVKSKMLTSELEPSLDVFADVMLNPAIEPMWVERVKSILQAQVLPNLEVKAEDIAQKVVRNTLYTVSPYRRQRFGTKETVASFDTAQVRKLYETYARPNNCVLAVYGDIDLAVTEKLLRDRFGAWERGDIPPSKVTDGDPGLTESKTVELENNQVRTNFRLAWRAFPRQAKAERAAMSVMSTIMGASGWLHARLREGENDYVYSVYTRPYAGDRVGHFFIETDFSPKDEKAVLDIIDGVVAEMRAGKFTDEELELAKRMILCYDALGKQDNADVTSGNALSELYGEGYDSNERYYARIRQVTREDVIKAANAIFSNPELRILIRPKSKE